MELLHKLIKIGDLNSFIDKLEDETSKKNKISYLTTNYSSMNCLHACCTYGHYDILKYIIELDYIKNDLKYIIDLQTDDQRTCLMIACSYQYYEIVKLLLDYGADTNIRNFLLRGALEYTAINGDVDIFKLLLEYDAKLYTCSDSKMQTIMIAAYNAKPSIVNYIIEIKLCTKLEEIEALEVLGCVLILYQKVDQGISYLKAALNERIKHTEFSKLHEVNIVLQGFENIKEYQTFEELDEMRDNRGKLLIQSILMLNRILPSYHYILENYISHSCIHFERIGDYNKALFVMLNRIINFPETSPLALFLRTYELYEKFLLLFIEINQHKSMGLAEFYMYFQFVFLSFCKQMQSNYDYLQMCVYRSLENYNRFNEAFNLLGFYITFFTELEANDSVKKEVHCIKKSIYETVRTIDLRSFGSKQTILHTIFIATNFHELKPYASLNVVKLLLECGASADAITNDGNNVLHYAMSLRLTNKQDEAKLIEIISYLLNSGVHLDVRNNKKQTPLDLCNSQSIFSFLKPIKHTTLKCICASKIRQFNIRYENIVPKNVEKFISHH